MKKLLTVLLTLLLLTALCGAGGEAMDLDALMAEIDAAEDVKGSTDGIYLMASQMDEVFFVGSAVNYFNRVEIINYGALAERFGGEPTVTCSETGDEAWFDACIGRIEGETGLYGELRADLIGFSGETIPREAAGMHEGTITITWGGLSAVVPIRALVQEIPGPALTGLSGLPDTVTLYTGEPWPVQFQPDPADWSYPGMRLQGSYGIAGSSLENPWEQHDAIWQDDTNMTVIFRQAGTYELEMELSAKYVYNGIRKDVFYVTKKVSVTVKDRSETGAIRLSKDALTAVMYTTSARISVDYVEITNYAQLAAALGGAPEVTCGSFSQVSFLPSVRADEDAQRGLVSLDLSWPDRGEGQAIPQGCAGNYATELLIQWGQLSATVPVKVSILPYTGAPLTGFSSLPDTKTLEVGEVWHVDARPDPADWTYADLYLMAGCRYDYELMDRLIVTGEYQYEGDTSFDLAFRQAGTYQVTVDLDAFSTAKENNREFTWTFGLSRTVTVTVTDGAVNPTAPLSVTENQAVHEISPDKRSIFIDKPTITGGTGQYTIAYNCYDASSNPVNYYYSDDARTAMTPGYNGRFNVFVVVRDSAGGEVQIDTGWLELTGNAPEPLSVTEQTAVCEISPDGHSLFINRPTISGGTHQYTIAYNCYDTDSNPVNYYYSDDWRTAMTPGYAGRFCVFVVVSDGQESVIINTGWHELN